MQYDKNTLYVKFVNEKNKVEAIKNPVYVLRQKRNNINLQCNVVKAHGVVSADGVSTYQFEGKPVMDPSYPVVRKITHAEFYEMQSIDEDYDYSDPELTDEEALDIILNGLIQ